jgi:urease accessory protein
MRRTLILTLLAGTLVSPVLAHTGVGQVNSFASGIAHPLSGIDHILAMTAVGLWAALAGGRSIWIWPTMFVATMLAGFTAAALGLQIPFVEPVIWSSIIVLGMLVALAVRVPIWLGASIVGLFALFHGHAHGTEVESALLIPYAAGFALATAALHATGIGLALFAEHALGRNALRTMGGLAVLGGIALIAG